MNRCTIADLIVNRLKPDTDVLRRSFANSGAIAHFTVDNLLPQELALRIRAAFPTGDAMRMRRSLREWKFIAAQMDRYDPLLEEAIFAFQDPKVVDLIGNITGLQALEPDDQLYAGGISMMVKGHFLNPHIDNSHDKNRVRYRVLNLLYYCSPRWEHGRGGHLELWPEGPKGAPVVINSVFNRLAVMVTHQRSWHSVSKVLANEARCCVSNYYFSKQPPKSESHFHVTSFRGRPEQPLRDFVLRADVALRTAVRRLFPKGVYKINHFYDKR